MTTTAQRIEDNERALRASQAHPLTDRRRSYQRALAQAIKADRVKLVK